MITLNLLFDERVDNISSNERGNTGGRALLSGNRSNIYTISSKHWEFILLSETVTTLFISLVVKKVLDPPPPLAVIE